MNALLKYFVRQWKILAAIAVVIVLAIAVYKVVHQKELPLLPASILHLALTNEIHGEAARQQINSMHGKNVTPEENEIGTYSFPGWKRNALHLTLRINKRCTNCL